MTVGSHDQQADVALFYLGGDDFVSISRKQFGNNAETRAAKLGNRFFKRALQVSTRLANGDEVALHFPQ